MPNPNDTQDKHSWLRYYNEGPGRHLGKMDEGKGQYGVHFIDGMKTKTGAPTNGRGFFESALLIASTFANEFVKPQYMSDIRSQWQNQGKFLDNYLFNTDGKQTDGLEKVTKVAMSDDRINAAAPVRERTKSRLEKAVDASKFGGASSNSDYEEVKWTQVMAPAKLLNPARYIHGALNASMLAITMSIDTLAGVKPGKGVISPLPARIAKGIVLTPLVLAAGVIYPLARIEQLPPIAKMLSKFKIETHVGQNKVNEAENAPERPSMSRRFTQSVKNTSASLVAALAAKSSEKTIDKKPGVLSALLSRLKLAWSKMIKLGEGQNRVAQDFKNESKPLNPSKHNEFAAESKVEERSTLSNRMK